MISIIIPFYNEAENLPILYRELIDVLEKIKEPSEVIFVDDGSTDKSQAPNSKSQTITKIQIKKIKHKTRLGKGAALNTGIKNSSGDVIIFMDGDLQDDPQDIPEFLKKIDEGYDLVNGVRTIRKDNSIIKTYSRLFNSFLKLVFRSPFNDINCGFKAIRKQVFNEIILYGNNFRFLPLAAFYKGYRVAEIPVANRPRQYGVSKFGAGKAFIGLIDTLTAYFIYQFSEQPLHFFGTIGAVFFIAGFIIAFVLSFQRIFYGMLLYRRPALLFAILLIIVGLQIVLTGIIGELIVYLDKKKK
jgi:glycosyltransferase involved in cell wall biosynthesis